MKSSLDTTRSTPISTSSVPNVSRFSVPMKGGEKGEGKRILHEQRRHTKKEHEEPTVERFSESDIREFYYHATSEEVFIIIWTYSNGSSQISV